MNNELSAGELRRQLFLILELKDIRENNIDNMTAFTIKDLILILKYRGIKDLEEGESVGTAIAKSGGWPTATELDIYVNGKSKPRDRSWLNSCENK